MRNKLAILTAKLTSGLLRLLGRRAGTVPGRLALKLSPRVRDSLKLKGRLVVITGTNGKTTTANILAEVLRRSGKTVVVNSHGNNIDWGITTTLLQHANLRGEVAADFVVLETDEHWVPVLYQKPNLKPDTLIILDFFRDQLDRAGEMETIVRKLEKFVARRDFNLILNGDDPNVVRIGRAHTKGKNLYYGLAELPTSYRTSTDKMEGIICPNCKIPLTYDYYQYSHLGRFHCERCGFQNAPLATQVTQIKSPTFTVASPALADSSSNPASNSAAAPASDSNSASNSASASDPDSASNSNSTSASALNTNFTPVPADTFTTTNPNLYNIYNLLSIITFAHLYHLDLRVVKNVFATYEAKNGRYQTFYIDGKKCTLNLCKNPTGFNVVLRSIRRSGKRKDLLLVLNDHINDGHDVSWIWDIDFSDLSEFDRIICAGTRAFDMAIPVKCNNFNPRNIIVIHDLEAAVRTLLEGPNRKYIISNYSPLVQIQKILTKLEHAS